MKSTKYSALSKSMMFKLSTEEILERFWKHSKLGPIPENWLQYSWWSRGMSFLTKIQLVLMQQDFEPLQNNWLVSSVASFYFILFCIRLGPSVELISFSLFSKWIHKEMLSADCLSSCDPVSVLMTKLQRREHSL